VIENGESSGLVPWQPEMVIGSENIIDKSGYTWNKSYLGYLNGFAPDWIYQTEAIAEALLSTFSGWYQALEFEFK